MLHDTSFGLQNAQTRLDMPPTAFFSIGASVAESMIGYFFEQRRDLRVFPIAINGRAIIGVGLLQEVGCDQLAKASQVVIMLEG